MLRRCLPALFSLALYAALPAAAQPTAAVPADVDTLVVTARRRAELRKDVPAALTVLGPDEIQHARQQLGLDESLARVPGLFLQNRYNFSQDLRISSRGFGARSAFGIRGIKLFVDGIPATLADGQAGVDAIDLGSTGRIEVLRGPASALYGAASGGVIHIHTEDAPEHPFVETRLSLGSDGFEKQQLKAGARSEKGDILLSASHFDYDGYRELGDANATSVNGRVRYQIDDDARLALTFNSTHSPWAGDSGGLTRVDSRNTRRSAFTRNVRFDAGESVDQQRLGLLVEKSFGERHHVTLRNYAVWRDFSNRLPFTSGGSVELERFFGGGGLQYSYDAGARGSLTFGVDIDAQRDDRERFDNIAGQQGAMTLSQDEDVTAVGVFGMARLALHEDIDLSVGARYDRVEFEVDDSFLSDGDGSDEIDFTSFSPSLALLWRVRPELSLYGSVSTSFETPTTTEFANPAGGGFNSDLEEQRSTNYELGLRGTGPLELQYEAALFHIDLEDELVPFELASQPGRRFFRNAGSSERDGVELSASFEPYQGLVASLAYTYSDFEFDDFQTPSGRFDGNRQPGVPKDQLFAELAYRHESGFAVAWEFLWADEFFVDDANTTFSRETWVSNLRISHRFEVHDFEIVPFAGINNLFDAEYDANVRTNAFGARYFEPAPDRSLYVGLRVRYTFGS